MTPGADALTGARARLAALPSGYHALFDRLVDVVSVDERIRSCWLGGSVARGHADAGSDLDILLAVRDTDLAGFAAGWRGWLESVTPVLLARELPGMPGSFFSTTADCCRLDVVTEAVSTLAGTPYRSRSVVIDRDGLDALVPATTPEDAAGPDAAAIAGLVEEFFRQQAIFPAAVVARQDWLLGVVAVHNASLLLYELFVACNAPLPPMGVKQWSSRLTTDQRELLARLPQPCAERGSVVSAMVAVRTAVRTHGRTAVEAIGHDWPDELDDAVSAFWRSQGL